MAISRAIAQPIERWLHREAPDGCVTLALVCGGISDSVVSAWTRAQFDSAQVGDFAASLVEAAEDHAQGIGRESRYFVKWLNAEGATVVSYMWRAGEGLNLNLDGSVESQLAQLQRHSEANAKHTHQAIGSLLEHYQIALADAQRRIKDLEQVRDAYELERLEKVANAGTPPAAEESQIEKLAKAIEGFERVSGAIEKVAPRLKVLAAADTKAGGAQ